MRVRYSQIKPAVFPSGIYSKISPKSKYGFIDKITSSVCGSLLWGSLICNVCPPPPPGPPYTVANFCWQVFRDEQRGGSQPVGVALPSEAPPQGILCTFSLNIISIWKIIWWLKIFNPNKLNLIIGRILHIRRYLFFIIIQRFRPTCTWRKLLLDSR